ncbi:MAG: hypothetical protein BGP06_02260 [Rhizobiales bacterium 65-9]|nr:glutamyl-tRNA reductase [Hyphomicrobiales bacterium]OJY34301.1 MAG: hypothetical protein BGP06_02260 [Rhizobiales bacterium 65-9]
MAGGLSIAIDLLVALLLGATIFYCITLEKRLKQLRADEEVMRRTIADLSGATESAERAIGVLKQTVSQADASLALRLESAERFAADLSANVHAGEEIIERVRQIVETSRRAAAAQMQPAPTTPSVEPAPATAVRGGATRLAAAAIAAERLAERARARQRVEAA